MELQFYILPFRKDKYCDWVYDANDNFIFQFENNMEEGYTQLRDNVLSILNGNSDIKLPLNLMYDDSDGTIHVDNEEFIVIRGWGRLTSQAGHNLHPDKATEIQDNLAKWILFKLTKLNTNEHI